MFSPRLGPQRVLDNFRQLVGILSTSASGGGGGLSRRTYYSYPRSSLSPELRAYNERLKLMLHIRFDRKADTVNLSVKVQMTPSVEREFNMLRSVDEPLAVTFQKLYANYSKQLSLLVSKSNKKAKSAAAAAASSNAAAQEKEFLDETLRRLNEQVKVDDASTLPMRLLTDETGDQVPLSTLNRDAWRDNYIFELNDQRLIVAVDLPAIKKISMSKLLVCGLSVSAKVEATTDTDDVDAAMLMRHSIFRWYCSEQRVENGEADSVALNVAKKLVATGSADAAYLTWKLLHSGFGRREFVLGDECAGRLLKVECVPSDGVRQGLALEHLSTNVALNGFHLAAFPMTERHALTAEWTSGQRLRVMTYNILANCYSETSLAKEHMYPYCPPEYLSFIYRRPLIIHEIKNFKSDIVFLQECEQSFYEDDLKASFDDHYVGHFKPKENSKEGCAILIRSSRFKLVATHDICITEELKSNSLYHTLWYNICKDATLKELIDNRTNILQVVQVESLDTPGVHYLLANTHLFFHPKADFTRLVQAIVSGKYLEMLKFKLLDECGGNKEEQSAGRVSDVKIIFAGDFNSDPGSYAFSYLYTQSVPCDILNEDEKEMMSDCAEHFIHSLNMSAYTDFPFTNCVLGFEGILDYVFFESNAFELARVIPLPSVEKLKEKTALPSQYIPSDHLPLVFEFEVKK